MSSGAAPSKLIAGRLVLHDRTVDRPCLLLDRDGLLTEIASAHDAPLDGTSLSPAFLDIHMHGALGYDVMSATPSELSTVQRFLATRGVAHYLPTTVTSSLDATLRALERLAEAIERGAQPLEAQPIGIHLEGPFLAETKRGVHPTAFLLPPSVAVFERMQTAARGHILLITLAPELPGAVELIRHVTSQGVRVSLGHTNATAAEALAAIDAGATSATHTFNAMRPLDHREPGVLGVVLDDPRVFAELICDGVHIAPALVRLWLKTKGGERAILVTDAMSATGGDDGAYTLGGLPVTVANGRALLTGDLQSGKQTLAGSLLTMDRAVANLREIAAVGLPAAVRLATHTPAAMLRRPELTAIAPGSPANLNRFDEDGRLIATYLRGLAVPR